MAVWNLNFPYGPAETPQAGAPFAVGDSSGNIKLNSAALGAYRWVAKRTGTLSKFWIKVKATNTDGSSYVGGTLGSWQANTYLAGADGLPSGAALVTEDIADPHARMVSDSSSTNNAIALVLNIPVVQGAMYITTIGNTDAAPATNYASTNHLYTSSGSSTGLLGAQSFNDLDVSDTRRSLYGLDPREAMGGKSAGGTWYWPGNNNGALAKYLPTYVQEYQDGTKDGQPYYSASQIAAATQVQMDVTLPTAAHTIVGIGAYLNVADSFTATMTVASSGDPVGNAVTIASAGAGFVGSLFTYPSSGEAALGTKVRITATPAQTGSLRSLYADTTFATLMGHGADYKWSYVATPARAVALWPITLAGGH